MLFKLEYNFTSPVICISSIFQLSFHVTQQLAALLKSNTSNIRGNTNCMSRNHLDLAGLIPSSHTRSVNAIQQATCLTVGVFTIGRLPSADASVESSCASPPTDISQSKMCKCLQKDALGTGKLCMELGWSRQI